MILKYTTKHALGHSATTARHWNLQPFYCDFFSALVRIPVQPIIWPTQGPQNLLVWLLSSVKWFELAAADIGEFLAIYDSTWHCDEHKHPDNFNCTVGDLTAGGGGGCAGQPLALSLISFIFMQFSGKFWQNNRLAPPPLGLASPHLVNPGSATAAYWLLHCFIEVFVNYVFKATSSKVWRYFKRLHSKLLKLLNFRADIVLSFWFLIWCLQFSPNTDRFTLMKMIIDLCL